MIRSRIAVPALVALVTLIGVHPAPAAAAQETDEPREGVVVTGTGEVFGEPDTLTANFAVETTAATVDAALTSANTAATRMRDALVRAGITKADLQTSEVSITSKQNDDRVITGYTVLQGLTAKTRNLPQAGAIISAATAAGGDAARLNGVSFAIEDDAALLADARKKAFADARGKAELYAQEAGRKLDRVVRVSEESARYYAGGEQNKLVAADSAVPIEPGRQQLTVMITVEWTFV
ncbi:SIMPL domain-containing protein [Actinoplanes sp. NPDC051861]|uniref:SIMPL domain-containing protein n=1 Tax=Actinoplanes sp. NPDC051861 TaxID=3155170 RepID=UPI0034227524